MRAGDLLASLWPDASIQLRAAAAIFSEGGPLPLPGELSQQSRLANTNGSSDGMSARLGCMRFSRYSSLAKVEMVQFVHHFRESALMCVLFLYDLLRCRF